LTPEVPHANRVLVVDDSEPIHKLIEARLRPEGLDVTSELSGARGVERAIADKPDLILLDIDLPDLDGFEVCRQLKDHQNTKDIPIIFLTGTTSTESKVRGLDLGAVDYVTKPFYQVELRARVRAALRTKRLQDLLEHQSFLDGLTGLWNRKYLEQRMESELNIARRYGRPVSLILADIDHFKQINDTHGHLFGDIVLQGTAECLPIYARRSDIVTRYGGEEFAILLADTSLRAAAYVAERLRAGVEARCFEAHGEAVSVTASFGIACTQELQTEITRENLILAADRALYASKDGGRNQCQVAKGSATTPVAVYNDTERGGDSFLRSSPSSKRN
jgi:two-component system cell cycle response regulator